MMDERLDKLQELLAGQLQALQRVMAFNQEMTRCMRNECSPHFGLPPGSDAFAIKIALPGEESQQPGAGHPSACSSALVEPLLGNWPKRSHRTAAQAALQKAAIHRSLSSPWGDRQDSTPSADGRRSSKSTEDVTLRSQALDIGSRCRAAAARLVSNHKESPASGSSGQPRIGRRHTMKHLFDKPKEIKRGLIESFNKPDIFNVEELYSQTGHCQLVARSSWFKNLTLAMILFSTLWVAVDTDYNKAKVLSEAPLVFQVVDNVLCAFFAIEIAVRWFAYEKKTDALIDWSFLFDLFLVVLMISETWLQVLLHMVWDYEFQAGCVNLSSSLRIMRLLRVARAFRMSRLFRSVPELMILVNGMVMAIRSVCTTLMLLVLVTYTFAVAMTQLLSATAIGVGKFDSVPAATNFLLLQVLCGFDGSFITEMLHADWMCYIILLVYMLLGSLTIMNMLIGVLVEVVGTTAELETDERCLKALKKDIAEIIAMTDKDGDHTVTSAEFTQMISNPESVQKLYEGGVNVLALVDYADFVFRDCDELSLEDFTQTVLEFRGSNQATVKDVVDLRVFMSKELARMEKTASMLPAV